MKKASKIVSLVPTSAMALSMSAYGGNTAETAAGTAAADTVATTITEAAKTSKEDTGEAKEMSAQAVDGMVYKIGVLQLVQHTTPDVVNQGFIATLDNAGIAYKVDQQNASGDQSACQAVAPKFANDKEDLILVTATPAVQAVAGVVSGAPMLVTTMTDPAESGLVDINGKPGGSVTGTSDLTSVKKQVELLRRILPDAKKMGILYRPAGSNSEIQTQMAKEAIETAGMTNQDFAVSSFNKIQTIVWSMVGRVDAIYALMSNTIATGVIIVGIVVGGNKLPITRGESGMMENDGLATHEIDYYQLDYMTGQQAVRILIEGASPTDMPVEYFPAEKCGLTINEETAPTLGIDVSNLK